MSGDTQHAELVVHPGFNAGRYFSELWGVITLAGPDECDTKAWVWAREVVRIGLFPLPLAEKFVELALITYKASLQPALA